MIKIDLNRRDFEYDVHSLVKAFYPEKEVSVLDPSNEDPMEQKVSVFFNEDHVKIEIRQPDAASAVSREKELFPHAVLQEDQAVPDTGLQEGQALQDTGLKEGRAELPAPSGERVLRSGEAWWSKEADRTEIKNKVKYLLYQILKEYTGRSLPWGNLTGIRPVKISMSLLEQGWKNTDIARHLRENYKVSAPKAALSIAIANREKAVLDSLDYRNGYSLYVGIPFCPSICLYCSFSSNPIGRWKKKVDAYLDTVIYEMEQVSEMFGGKEPLTVYIGGGTPTTLEPEQMDTLICALKKYFGLTSVREFTVEAGRPDSITPEKLAVLKKHGVSRISVNPQTMNQKTLDLIGREHTTEQIVSSFYLAREMGFDNINMDLIIGLPGEGLQEVRHTMEELKKLSPDSITVHSLALKRAARLNLMKDSYQDISFRNSDEIMDMTMNMCREMGRYPYYLYRQKNMAGNFENVGYAREGCEGLYNILIMEEVQSIMALGAGTVTKCVDEGGLITRCDNVKSVEQYMERIDEMVQRKRELFFG